MVPYAIQIVEVAIMVRDQFAGRDVQQALKTLAFLVLNLLTRIVKDVVAYRQFLAKNAAITVDQDTRILGVLVHHWQLQEKRIIMVEELGILYGVNRMRNMMLDCVILNAEIFILEKETVAF